MGYRESGLRRWGADPRGGGVVGRGSGGLTAAAPARAVTVCAAHVGGEEAEEKPDFNVLLTDFADKKIQVIKVVREATGLGLKAAKDLVEGIPKPVKEGLEKKEAEELKKKNEEAGVKGENR